MKPQEKLIGVLIALLVGMLLGNVGLGVQAGVNDSQTNRVRGCVKDANNTTSLTLGGRSVPPNTILRVIDPDNSCLTGEQQVEWYRHFSTIIVGPLGTNTANGAALLAAVSSATSGQLIKLEPGTYDLGGGQLLMKAGVSIEGSGVNLTIIRSNRGAVTASSAAAVIVSEAAHLRDLRIESNGTGQQVAIGLYHDLTNFTTSNGFRLSNVEISVQSATASNFGLYRTTENNFGFTERYERLTVAVSGGSQAVAVRLDGFGSTTLQDCELTVLSGSSINQGVLSENSGNVIGHEINNCSIRVGGAAGSQNIGVKVNDNIVNIINTRFRLNSGGSIGVHNTSGDVSVISSKFNVGGFDIYSEGLAASPATFSVEHSQSISFSNQANSTLRIANSRLNGSKINNGGTVQCFNNYSESMAAVTC